MVTVLDGDDWQLRGCLGREWEWHVGADKPWDAPHWLPARVPGSVLDDLVRAGVVPSPYHERDSLLAEWVPERSWIYRRRVTGPGIVRFEGVDFEATVFVDGEERAHHVGLFTPFDVPVDEGEHVLAVVVHASPESEPQVGRTSEVRVHKPRMSYGWDFCPRMVHQGIWRSVVLHDDPPADEQPVVTLEDGVGVVRLGGEEVRIEEPELWWPNGSGAQRLYHVELAGRPFEVGFRTVELRDGYSLVVNGERVAIRGWNWTPIDPLYGVPRPEKLARLLELAARANVNLLRVWGGGLIESEEFYAHCDRLGLLVWQEFSQSSSGLDSTPAADEEFVRTLADDARAIVPGRRAHPSLAVWCGGNELTADDSHPALGALRGVVEELDPGRVWLPTSPRGEDVHGPWEHQGLRAHYELYDGLTARLHSEFGVEGMTNRESLEALIDAEHRWPADRSNPVYEHLGAWWCNEALVQSCFGARLTSLESLRRASQWLQYDGLRYAVEAAQRRGCGTIPWQFNESFPNAWCTAAVDYHGVPKPAYFGVARAYRGAPSAQFATCAWGGEAELRARIHGDCVARVVDLHGAVLAEARDEIVVPLDRIGTDVFLLDLDGRNRYVLTRTEDLAPLLDLPPATLDTRDGVVRNVGEVAAIGLVTEDDVVDLLPGEQCCATRGEGWNARL
ncbi:MAG TPA: glycoside hydrolase family 2 TIM barrel-domain containing protein [Gaiellaceae bacterium]|nr:glycoside hydrolase family 2 TIM barrel-domain containing protein [Gaiellaceae bacterium]